MPAVRFQDGRCCSSGLDVLPRRDPQPDFAVISVNAARKRVTAGTSPAIVSKVHRDVSQVLAQREVQEKFATAGLEILGEGPEAFARTIASDHERMGRLARQIDLKVD